MPRPQDIGWRKSQQAQAAAGNPPPPDGPNGLFRTATATPPDEGDHWEPGPVPQLGYTYIASHLPAMPAINQSMDHGDMLSEEQVQVSFEIKDLGEVFFGMFSKERMGQSCHTWSMVGFTADLGKDIYAAKFCLDFQHQTGTVVFENY